MQCYTILLMRILIAYEESQAVCKAFRDRGHEAYSCDIQPCSGGHPEWHIHDDVISHLNGWDLIIAHPPCTYFTRASPLNRHDTTRILLGYRILEDIYNIWNSCDKVCVENPQGLLTQYWRNPDQYIQPYYFGHTESKRTGLWLKNLPLLLYTFTGSQFITNNNYRLPPSTERSKIRSKTFHGIAKAMAQQWG